MQILLDLIWFVGIVVALRFIVKPSDRYPIFSTRKRAMLGFLTIFFGVPILSAIFGINGSKQLTRSDNVQQAADSSPNSAIAPSDAPTADLTASEATSPWKYDESRDEMRGTVTKYARTESIEDFSNQLGSDDEKTTLELQKRTRGYDVAIVNGNLQFTCNSFSGTRVSVKFDNGPIERFGCTDAVGNRYGVAFVSSGNRFVGKLRHAKKLMIEAEVFQRGDLQMKFDVAGLSF